MKTIKRASLTIVLTLAFASSGIAGEVSSPPCPSPDPGEMQAPPCSVAQETSDDPAARQTSTLPSASAVTEYVVANTAIDFVESVLSLL